MSQTWKNLAGQTAREIGETGRVHLSPPTPRPHAERAPEGEVPAEWVELAAAVLRDSRLVNVCGDGRGCRCEEAVEYSLVSAHDMLAAVLDVEEMARVIQADQARRHGWTALRWEHLDERHRDAYRADATALRAAILGGAA